MIDIDAAQMCDDLGSVCGMIARGDVARLTFRDERIVMLSERVYDKIEQAFEDVERGEGIVRPIEELRYLGQLA